MNPRSRGWVFTINNWTDDDLIQVKSLSEQSVYIICEKEIGEKGTPPLQGYVLYENQRSFSSMKKKLLHASLRASVGSPKQNQVYCSKDGVFFEFGKPPDQGHRTDIEEVRSDLAEGSRMRDIVCTCKSYQSLRIAEMWLKYLEKPRAWKPEVRWYYGPTGSGKTSDARQWLGDDLYTCLETAKWFKGYDAHENVMFDDMRRDFCKFHQLLKLLDKYECRVETKGGSRQFVPHKIVITAPFHPQDMFETREDVE